MGSPNRFANLSAGAHSLTMFDENFDYIDGQFSVFGVPSYNDELDISEFLGGRLHIKKGKTVTVKVPEDCVTVAVAYEATSSWTVSDGGSIVIDVNGRINESAIVNRNRSTTQVRGRTVLSRTLTGVSSVTGSAGDWDVTVTLNDASGVAVGDGIGIRNVRAGVHKAPGSYSGAIKRGELRLAFFQMGYLTTSGTDAEAYTSVSGDRNVSAYMSAGYLIHARGETRSIATIGVGGQGKFTLSSSFGNDLDEDPDAPPDPDLNLRRHQYWFYAPPATGYVSSTETSGSDHIVHGDGTSFLEETNVGDIILIDGHGPREIIAVDDDETLRVKFAYAAGDVPNIATNTRYAIVTNGELHEGESVVTAVAGNQVTFKNYGRSEKPPVNNVVEGVVSIKKTVLNYSASAFSIYDGLVDVDNLTMVGPDGSTTVAFDCRADVTRAAGGRARVGANCGIVKFGSAGKAMGNAHIDAPSTLASGQTAICWHADIVGSLDLTSAVVNGTASVGVMLAGGSNARLSDARLLNTGAQSLRAEVGASFWADFTIVVSGYILLVGAVNAHLVGLRAFLTKAGAITGQNGGTGRASGALVLCSRSNGLTLYNAHFEANQASISGCYGSGVIASRSRLSMTTSGACYSRVTNLYALDLADVSADKSVFPGAHSYAMRSVGQAKINARGAYIGPNGGLYDVHVSGGGRIHLDGATGYVNTYPTSLNEVQSDGSVIYNNAVSAPAKITPLVGSTVWNPGTLSAGATAEIEFDFAGATTTNCGIVFQVNGTLDSGIDVRPTIKNTDKLFVHIQNTTASPIAVGNHTWTFIVMKMS